MKKFAALCFALSAPLLAATSEQIIPDQEAVKLSGLSVACYGTAPGKCKSGSTSLSYKDFVNQLAGKPVIVQAVYYFKDRDDKVLLEYAILEDEYEKAMGSTVLAEAEYMGSVAASVLNEMSNGSQAERTRLLNESEANVKANCPTAGGCQALLNFIERKKDSQPK